MFYYYFIIAFIFGSAVLSLDKRISQSNALFIVFMLVIMLSVLGGTRTIGYDYDLYYKYFSETPSYFYKFVNTDTSIEIGYESLERGMKTLSENFHVFLTFFTAASIGLSAILYMRWSPYPILSFMLYCSYALFVMVMGQIRQPFAINFAYLLFLPLLLKRKVWAAAFVVFLTGILFHKSLLIFAVLILFSEIRLTGKWITTISIFSAGCYLFASALLPILISIVPAGFYYADAVIAYLTYRTSSLSFSLGMIERAAICFVLFYYSYKYELYLKNMLLRLLINLYFFGVALYFSFIGISTEFAARGTHSCNFAMFLALPILAKNVKGKDKALVLMVIFLLALYHFLDFLVSPEIYNPYKSILIP